MDEFDVSSDDEQFFNDHNITQPFEKEREKFQKSYFTHRILYGFVLLLVVKLALWPMNLTVFVLFVCFRHRSHCIPCSLVSYGAAYGNRNKINEQRTTITLSTFIKFYSWPLTLTDRKFPFYTWKFIVFFFIPFIWIDCDGVADWIF